MVDTARDHPDPVPVEARAFAADELDRMADNIRSQAGDPQNGWGVNETYRAQKIFTQLRERAALVRGSGATT